MIKPVTDLNALKKAFSNIFTSANPFEAAATSELSARVVLYPTNLYYLDEEQFRALMAAITILDEAKFYISFTELKDAPFTAGGPKGEIANWECEKLTYEEYLSIDLFMENAIYSASGTWGILLSHELHALFVSSDGFWNNFSKNYRNWKRDIQDFVKLWERWKVNRGVDISWLPTLLNHLTVIWRD